MIIKSALLSSDIPDPDMLIRSGGYNRLSDFFIKLHLQIFYKGIMVWYEKISHKKIYWPV